MDFGGTVKGASGGRTSVSTRKEPVGVAGLITPWNYPIAIPAWKMAPALATGNAVVLKPATQAPGPALELAKALDEAGAPDGIVNVVVGSGSSVGTTLTDSEDVDAVSFTGARRSASRSTTRRPTTPSAPRPRWAGRTRPSSPTARTSTRQSTSSASAPSASPARPVPRRRAIVHTDVYDEFVAGITEYAESLDIGPGLDDPGMGPHVNEGEFESTLDYVDIAKTEGATHEFGGDRVDEGDLGRLLRHASRLLRRHPRHAPLPGGGLRSRVLAVTEVEDFDEAIEVANDTEYGLSASVVTDDLAEAHEFIDRTESGVAKVNEKTTGLELHVPFGGYKQSSTNTFREQGDAAIDFFTQTKTVYMNHSVGRRDAADFSPSRRR